MLANEPLVGAVFEMCILLDLNKKMNATWTHESLVRYKQLLECSLLDNEITVQKKKYIDDFRRGSFISEESSNKLVCAYCL